MAEATRQVCLPVSAQGEQLIRINSDSMPGNEPVVKGTGITIRHGGSIISLPTGSSAESVADLVKALNRHV